MIKEALVAAVVSVVATVPTLMARNAAAADVVVVNSAIQQTASSSLPDLTTPPAAPPSTDELIASYAAKYGVSAAKMAILIDCEDPGRDPAKQSDALYTFSDPSRGIVKGERERSWGLAQIHLPDHPGITIAQATDPAFSLDFMARELAAGHRSLWYC